jgi:hypothetical protein
LLSPHQSGFVTALRAMLHGVSRQEIPHDVLAVIHHRDISVSHCRNADFEVFDGLEVNGFKDNILATLPVYQ